MAAIKELKSLQQPLIDALHFIHEDMERARSGGDEWAMEWMGGVWTELPLAVRAAAGDQDAAHELADQVRAAEEAGTQPAPAQCTCGSAGPAFVPAGHYRDCPQHEAHTPAVEEARP
jgi:hypothetical protein